MSYSKRSARGTAFENRVEQTLRWLVVDLAKNGLEHTHPGFTNSLRDNNSRASLLMRHAPDGVAVLANFQVFYWEAKGGQFLKYVDYQVCRYFDQAVAPVLMCFDIDDEIRVVRAGRITFLDSEEYVSRFPHAFPVREGWICPDRKPGIGNGAPYRVIDPSCTVGLNEHTDLEGALQ